MSLLEDLPEGHPRIPVCPCCGGNGMHGHKPYVYSSPYDQDEECTACAGSGRSWFRDRQNSCAGYHNLLARFR